MDIGYTDEGKTSFQVHLLCDLILFLIYTAVDQFLVYPMVFACNCCEQPLQTGSPANRICGLCR